MIANLFTMKNNYPSRLDTLTICWYNFKIRPSRTRVADAVASVVYGDDVVYVDDDVA